MFNIGYYSYIINSCNHNVSSLQAFFFFYIEGRNAYVRFYFTFFLQIFYFNILLYRVIFRHIYFTIEIRN